MNASDSVQDASGVSTDTAFKPTSSTTRSTTSESKSTDGFDGESPRSFRKWLRNVWHRQVTIPAASQRRKTLDVMISERRRLNKNPHLKRHQKLSLKPRKIFKAWMMAQQLGALNGNGQVQS